MTDGSMEEASAFSDAATHDQAEPEASKRSLKPSTRKALIVIGIVAVLMALVLVYIYVIEGSKYVSTDNAQIDGDQISVNAPSSGTLTDWMATQGTHLHEDQLVGRIKILGGFVQPQQPIRAPGNGT